MRPRAAEREIPRHDPRSELHLVRPHPHARAGRIDPHVVDRVLTIASVVHIRVRTARAHNAVVARPAHEGVRLARAVAQVHLDQIVPRAPLDRVVRPVAERDRVVSLAPAQHVRAPALVRDHIIAPAPFDHVAAVRIRDHIITGVTYDEVISGPSSQVIRSRRSLDDSSE